MILKMDIFKFIVSNKHCNKACAVHRCTDTESGGRVLMHWEEFGGKHACMVQRLNMAVTPFNSPATITFTTEFLCVAV